MNVGHARSLHELLQSISDVMFPGDEGHAVAIDSVGYDGDTPLHVMEGGAIAGLFGKGR